MYIYIFFIVIKQNFRKKLLKKKFYIVFIVIKYFFRNKKIVFGVIGNEISFQIIPEILFYDYNFMIQKKFLNKIKKFLIKKDYTYTYC
jgi:hypothetical protein